MVQPDQIESPHTIGSSVESVPSLTYKNICDVTRGKGTKRLVRQMGHAISVLIPSSSRAPEGEHATFLANGIRKEIRLSAPVRNSDWDKIDAGIREVIIRRVRQRFDIGDYENDLDIQDAIKKKCQGIYRGWKHELHADYLCLIEKGVPDPKNHPPERVDPNDWASMIDVWETEDWKIKSNEAKVSRSKMPYNHISGSRSFAESMLIIPQPEVTSPMSELDISIDVLGRRPGYLKQYGIYVRGSSLIRSITESAERDAEVVALKETMASQAEQIAAQAKKTADLEALVHQLFARDQPAVTMVQSTTVDGRDIPHAEIGREADYEGQRIGDQ